MNNRHTIMERLDREPPDALIDRVKGYLEQEGTRLVGDRSSKVSVAEALRLWTTRLENRDLTGQELFGAEAFVGRLKTLTRQRKLEQYAFIGADAGGNVFFEGQAPHHLVGAIVFRLGTAVVTQGR